MSIKSNKEITLRKKKNNRKVILVIEDEYDWCFPEFVWEHIKNFVGIFSKVNQYDLKFLAEIQKKGNYRKEDCLGKHMMGVNIYKQVLKRCLKDPTYCRLQAYKWFKKPAPRRKGYEFIGATSYDFENMGDNSYVFYRMKYNNPIPKLCGPISQKIVEAKFWEDYHSGKFTKVKRNGGTITRVSIDQMKLIRAQKKIEPDLQSDFVKKQMKEEADPMFVRVGGIRCKVLSDEDCYSCQRCDLRFQRGSEAFVDARIKKDETYCGDCNRWFDEQDELSDAELSDEEEAAEVKVKAEEVKEAKAKWMGEYEDPKSLAKLLSGINWNMEKLQKAADKWPQCFKKGKSNIFMGVSTKDCKT